MSETSDTISERTRQATKIVASPQDYKVCEGCGSIVTERTVSCPSCHAYCFDAGAERVTAQAQLLATRHQNAVLSSDLA
jgi:NADH pyrophosphatase NudC (nudix superfamily)